MGEETTWGRAAQNSISKVEQQVHLLLYLEGIYNTPWHEGSVSAILKHLRWKRRPHLFF